MRPYRILVADDDPDNRNITRLVLERAGHKVLEAANGLEAVEIAFREKPDLILLDMSMPKLNGWETARRIRENPDLRGVPILAFTAHALEGDERKARAAGCSDYLPKPCSLRDLSVKVETLLNSVPAAV